MSRLDVKIGYWYSKNEPGYPKPVSGLPFEDQEIFIKKLENIQKRAVKKYYKGYSTCRICKCSNGSVEYMSRGYVWPEGYLHYIKEHNVKPDEKFFKLLMGL